jgi:integrase
VKRWGARPITDITPEEVAAAIRAIVKRGAPYQAHNALGYIRRLFNWAIGTHEFGIRTSPIAQLKPKDLIGKREARERTLSDEELRALWMAAGEMGYPYGPIFRLLILSGQREREVSELQGPEVDLRKQLWTIPADRMKGGRAHEVPLLPVALSLIEALPQWNGGEYVFSTTAGKKPVNSFSSAKVRIDKLSGVSDWVIHDLRRTMRTHLPRCRCRILSASSPSHTPSPGCTGFTISTPIKTRNVSVSICGKIGCSRSLSLDFQRHRSSHRCA